ncbi:hypothetical protein CP556_16870 [Natrinema sp. CBA1119]|uniref:hypothetical protein n=1 Tax=Natrinema sp. CBA1119 TaxID=1608465 RepID=UPI000BFA26CB|nr:hypothetical protein [Natrinema sp. CBA1119]PGF17606.1 hypothetical protein CP556_16870 [Natrinema sp. CBA1119]
MSVFRQPEVLGRSTRRRVVGVTAALSAAAVEMLAVGCWFVLVVDSRTTSTALAGLGVLFCGSLLRAGVFGATVSDIGDLLQPRRLGVTVLLTTGWLVWLLVAELIGAVPGVVVATVILAGILTAQFLLEQRVFRRHASTRVPFTPVVPGLLLAVGASMLLATGWFTDWSLSSPPVSLGVTTVVLEIKALHIGVLVFGLFAFLAHQYRFQRVLDP